MHETISLETSSDVMTERTIPIASVCPNPCTVPEPKIISTIATINVVTFPSMMAEVDFLKPCLIASFVDLPASSSSFIRVFIITFPSTAIPMVSMRPAIPDIVSVISNAFIKSSIATV